MNSLHLIFLLFGICHADSNLQYSTLFGPSVPLNPTTTQGFIDEISLTKLVHLDDIARTPEECISFCRSQIWCLAVDSCNYVTDLAMLNMDNLNEEKLLTHDSIINLSGLNFIVNQVHLVGNLDPATDTFQTIDPKRIHVLDDTLAAVTKSSHPKTSTNPENFFTYYFTTHGPDRNAIGADQSIRDGDLSGKVFRNFPVKSFSRHDIASTEPLRNQPFRPYYKNKLVSVETCNDVSREGLTEMIDTAALRSTQFFRIFSDENVKEFTKNRLKDGPHKFYLDCTPLDIDKEITCYWRRPVDQINTTFAIIDFHYAGEDPPFFGKTLLVYDISKSRQVGFLGTRHCFDGENTFVTVSHGREDCHYNKFNFINNHREAKIFGHVINDRVINFMTLCKKDKDIGERDIDPCITNTLQTGQPEVFDTQTFSDDLSVRLMGRFFNIENKFLENSKTALNLIIEPLEQLDVFNTFFLSVNGKPIVCDEISCKTDNERKQIFSFEHNGMIHPHIRGGTGGHSNANSRVAIYEKDENNIFFRTGYLGVNNQRHLIKRSLSEAFNDDYKWINSLQHFNTNTGKMEKIVFAEDHVQKAQNILFGNTITPIHVASHKYDKSVFIFDENAKVSYSFNHTEFIQGFDGIVGQTFDNFVFKEDLAIVFNNNNLITLNLTTLEVANSINDAYGIVTSCSSNHFDLFYITSDGNLKDSSSTSIHTIQDVSVCDDAGKKNIMFMNTPDEHTFSFLRANSTACDFYTFHVYDNNYQNTSDILDLYNPIHMKVSDDNKLSIISSENPDFPDEKLFFFYNSTSGDFLSIFKNDKVISWDVDFDVGRIAFLTLDDIFIRDFKDHYQTFAIDPSLQVEDIEEHFEINRNVHISGASVFAYYNNFSFFDYDKERYLEFHNDSFIEDFTTILDIQDEVIYLYNDVSFYHSNVFTHFDQELLGAESEFILYLSEKGSAPKENLLLLPTKNQLFEWKSLKNNEESIQCNNNEYVVSTRFEGDNELLGEKFAILCMKFNTSSCSMNTQTVIENVECTEDRVMVGIHRNSSLICKSLHQQSRTDTYPGVSSLVPFTGKIALHNSALDGSKNDDFKNPTSAEFFIKSKAAPIHSLKYSQNFQKIEHFRYFESPCVGTGANKKFTITDVDIPDESTDCENLPNTFINHVKCRDDDCRDGISALCVCANKCKIGQPLDQVFTDHCPSGMVVTKITCKIQDEKPCGIMELHCAPVAESNDGDKTCSIENHSHSISNSALIGIIVSASIISLGALIGLGFLCVCCLPDGGDKKTTNDYEENTFNFD